MIKTIIFDFGDVFINLDKAATPHFFERLTVSYFGEKETALNQQYEMGLCSTQELISSYQQWYPHLSSDDIITAWNAILLDFPMHRLTFLKQLAAQKKYKLILLSNTNDLHINWIKEHISFYEEFKSCFDVFYLSQEIHFRKPNADIFEFVVAQNQLIPEETLFIDDTKANTDTAQTLGIHVWNNNPHTEDVTDLFTVKANLF
ncbi:HAD family hydrolase [Aquimarina rhabdastrellae]